MMIKIQSSTTSKTNRNITKKRVFRMKSRAFLKNRVLIWKRNGFG